MDSSRGSLDLHGSKNQNSSEFFDTADQSKKSKDDGGPVLAREETKDVNRFRLLMMLILLVFAIVVSVLVYFYTRGVEENELEEAFNSNGNKVIAAFQEDSYRKMQALFSLSSAITSHAMTMNASWPFVTVPNSASVFGPYLSLADAAALSVFPIVPKHLRAEWEAYSVREQGWIEQDLQLQQFSVDSNNDVENSMEVIPVDVDNGSNATATYTSSSGREATRITPFIKNYVGVDTSPGIWTPWWQYYPVIPNRWFVNFNRLAWKGFPEQVAIVQNQGKATLSSTTTFTPGLDFQSTKDFEFTDQLLRAGGRGRYNEGEPLSYISYPIFDHFLGDDDNGNGMIDDKEKNKTVAAILVATVYWKSYFQGILADDVEGIICVVSNSVGQTFRYELNGREATFLGMGDTASGETLNNLRLTAEYSTTLLSRNNDDVDVDAATDDERDEGALHYTGVPVDDGLIAYTLDVYASKAMEDDYLTNRPIYFALAIGAVFILCAIIFVIYNKLVDYRQHVVMTTATKSAAVVDSIFPSNVRDRLMEDAPGLSSNNKTSQILPGIGTKISNNGNGQFGNGLSGHEQGGAGAKQKSQPIADHFEGTTVFFADLKGFTSWCDTREPVQVFTLLETVYAEFDRIAKRRRVYKVETVGDCYVAVTGLPQAQADHALRMARFGREVLMKFNELRHNLAGDLGEGTNQLGLRVGMHSGPVTAGVIRGDNARFQLFGDTVNTASRMESTGEAGRVQVSQSTADLLKVAGKSSWVTQRKDLVFAKGKGDLQTYWLQVAGTANSVMSGKTEASPLTHSSTHSESGGDNSDDEEEMASGDLSYLEGALRKRIEREENEKLILEQERDLLQDIPEQASAKRGQKEGAGASRMDTTDIEV